MENPEHSSISHEIFNQDIWNKIYAFVWFDQSFILFYFIFLFLFFFAQAGEHIVTHLQAKCGREKEVRDNCDEITDVWEGPWPIDMKKIMWGKARGSIAQSVCDAFIEQRTEIP